MITDQIDLYSVLLKLYYYIARKLPKNYINYSVNPIFSNFWIFMNEKPSHDTGQKVNKIPWRIHLVCFMSMTSITGQESSQGERGVLSTEACTIMGPWLDPIPYLLCSAWLACWPRKLQRDLWRSKRLTQLYNFNWVFCTKQLLVVCWKNWPQTTVITC